MDGIILTFYKSIVMLRMCEVTLFLGSLVICRCSKLEKKIQTNDLQVLVNFFYRYIIMQLDAKLDRFNPYQSKDCENTFYTASLLLILVNLIEVGVSVQRLIQSYISGSYSFLLIVAAFGRIAFSSTLMSIKTLSRAFFSIISRINFDASLQKLLLY